MKKYFILFTFLMLSACSQEPAAPQAMTEMTVDAPAQVLAPWVENTHYTVLNQNASDAPIVQEFFSFWCPHCYNFEPIVEQIKAQLSSATSFEKVHVDFMGFTSKDIQQGASKAMLMGRSMGIETRINTAIFAQIHVTKKDIGGMADLKKLFLANGVSEQAFNDALNSNEVNNLVDKHNATFMQYRGDLKSVPTFIVNGQYMATFTRDMTIDDMVALVVWLSNK